MSSADSAIKADNNQSRPLTQAEVKRQITYRQLDFLLMVTFVVINALAATGHLGAMSDMAFYATNMGISLGRGILDYLRIPKDLSAKNRNLFIAAIAAEISLSLLFNGLGMGQVGVFGNVANVAAAQLITNYCMPILTLAAWCCINRGTIGEVWKMATGKLRLPESPKELPVR